MDEDPKPFRLSKEHQTFALKMINENVLPRYRPKNNGGRGKVCNWCQGTRIDHTTEEGLIHPCERCVDHHKARETWKEYCKGFPELVERFLKKQIPLSKPVKQVGT